MKLSLKVLLLTTFLLAVFVRFYHFASRVTFGPEQAISLITSGKMVKEGISLLGQENVQRFTESGLQIFSEPVFSYALIPFQLVSGYDPVFITAFFSILNLLTGVLVYFLATRMFDRRVGLISAVLFLFNSFMIYHSLFIWILNPLPLVGLLTFFCLWLFKRKQKNIYPFVLGLLSGFGLSLEYLYVFTALVIFVFVFKYSRNKLRDSLVFLFGFLIPNLPTIIFDFRNEFYHFKTLIEYAKDTVIMPGKSKIDYYHFLQFWPVVLMYAGYLIGKVYKRSKALGVLIIGIYLMVNLNSPLVNFSFPTGMPKELTASNIESASEVIKKDSEGKVFNVSALVDFDSRGHVLRYYLEFMQGVSPLGILDYDKSELLYVVSKEDYNFYGESAPYEIDAMNHFSVGKLSDIGERYALYKLTKTN